MLHPIDPYVVRKLADCIELLPKYINSPENMPFVQEVIQRALEQINSDREAIVRGVDALTRGDELARKSLDGQKYRYEIGATLPDAEKYREPVTAVWLSDSDQKDLKDGFDEDDTGVFELLEREAAMIAEWLKENRHPRDAELFRSRFSFVCGEALLHAQGVEVSPGGYRLDLSTWETEVAKPLCDDLRELADEMDSTADTDPSRQRSDVGGTARSNEKPKIFVPTKLQKAILKALNGKAMKKQELADEVAGGEGTRIYRRGGIKELREIGRVNHKDGVGYFRPDAPPPTS